MGPVDISVKMGKKPGKTKPFDVPRKKYRAGGKKLLYKPFTMSMFAILA